MHRCLARMWWVGLLSCVCARSLPAQSSPGVGTAAAAQESGQAATPRQQQDSKPPQAQPVVANPGAEQHREAPPSLEPPPKRMFGMIPDFENTNDTLANRRPLTVGQKYILSLHQAFDFSAHIGNAFSAALQQAGNGQPRYGQGWGAYGQRFAAAEGDQISSSLLIYGTLPSLLHEDPRYFRRGRGSSMARIWYAINRTFVTRTDQGTSRFNISQSLGQLISCGISTSYYPPQDRSVNRVLANWAVNLGSNSAYNVLSEYYPDVRRMLFHRHAKPVVEPEPALQNGPAGH